MLKFNRRAAVLASSVLMNAGFFGLAQAADVVRTALPNGNPFPISSAVTVPAGFDTFYLSGVLPQMVNKDAPKGSIEAYGNMETQTMSVLTQIKATLEGLGLEMGDIVKMTVFMAGDPATDNKFNFPGLMASYSKFFGTADQPNKPARSAVQVAALAAPGALLEVEVIAVKPHGPAKKLKR
jgi:enamine deaminase RidA (YjgF/YER057c/UK114 family)